MSLTQLFICVGITFSTLLAADGFDGYYTYRVRQCRFSSWDLSDLEYIDTYWFNKAPVVTFNNTVGKYVGFTEFGVYHAEQWNNDTEELEIERAQKDIICQYNVQNDITYILTKSVKPKVTLRLGKPSIGDKPGLLMCSAYDYYPKMIKMAWYKDGKEVTGSVISTEELADGDWYYQIHSHLEFTPKAGEKVTCEVHHTSLKEPFVAHWDSSMPEPERNKIAIGAAGLVLGFVVTAAGFINYKRKSRVRILVPSS
ncbi:rano class II histocompatibility antigen, A beta chain-like [Engraulis encrasicolus]|uniref:rano class II histocompatibility antigen, A beta chain-like n=1 Tax=Engraulis encrasicolus TaxID=184585 RepID=UPI002FD4EAB3